MHLDGNIEYFFHWNIYDIKSNLTLCTSYAYRSPPMPEECQIQGGGYIGYHEPPDISAGI